MGTIRINTGYSEYDNTAFYRNFDIIDEIPQVGDYLYGEIVLDVTECWKDWKQPNDEAYLAECYEVKLTWNGEGEDSEDYCENIEYVAVIPEYEEALDEDE